MESLRAAWYMAAWRSDLPATGILPTLVLNERIVIYRGSSGKLFALEDRCAHKLAPLSFGQVEGDQLRCMYHGLKYNSSGQCIHIPGRESVPPAIRVKSYPVEEAHSAIWIWMGELARADAALIPPFQGTDHPDWAMIPGRMDYEANFSLINENLLDLSHVPFLHRNSFGGGRESPTMGGREAPVEKQETTELERGVRTFRTVENAPVPPFLREQSGPLADHVTTSDFLVPGVLLLTGELFKPGSLARSGGHRPDDDLLLHRNFSCQAVTPRTDRLTTYFYAFGPWRRHAAGAEMFAKIGAVAFEEDRAIINAQQKVMDASPGIKPMLLHMDSLAAKYNRVLQRLASTARPESAAT